MQQQFPSRAVQGQYAPQHQQQQHSLGGAAFRGQPAGQAQGQQQQGQQAYGQQQQFAGYGAYEAQRPQTQGQPAEGASKYSSKDLDRGFF